MLKRVSMLQAVSVCCGLAMLAMIIYLGTAIRSAGTIQDRLQYQPPQVTPAEVQPQGTTLKYTYVPVYPNIYAEGGSPLLLQVTLSIRNPDPLYPMKISAIDLYDTSGKRVRVYLDSAVSLAPMATAAYMVEKADSETGSGANFVVQWSSQRSGAQAVIESVMVGSSGERHFSFTSRGQMMPFPMPEK